jgi:coenzyme F420-reducing hydrogenase beta subunit
VVDDTGEAVEAGVLVAGVAGRFGGEFDEGLIDGVLRMRSFHDRAQPKVCQSTTFCRFLRTNGWLGSRTTPVLALRLDPPNVNGTNRVAVITNDGKTT